MIDEKFIIIEDLYKFLSHRLVGFSRGLSASMDVLREQLSISVQENVDESMKEIEKSLIELERFREELDSIHGYNPDDPCDLRVIFSKLEFLFEKSLTNLVIKLRSNTSECSFPLMAEVPFRVGFLSLENLLRDSVEAISSNSGEAPPGPRTINVDVEERDNLLLCHVTDDGPGLDRSVRKDPFDPLATTKPGGGSGLYRTRELLEKHGAGIEVTKPGPGGTVFTVSFPKPE